jgi:hypothetical protein
MVCGRQWSEPWQPVTTRPDVKLVTGYLKSAQQRRKMWLCGCLEGASKMSAICMKNYFSTKRQGFPWDFYVGGSLTFNMISLCFIYISYSQLSIRSYAPQRRKYCIARSNIKHTRDRSMQWLIKARAAF